MPLVATRGAASAQGFGEFAVTSTPTYIEDVFSTYLYTGTGAALTITNNIDLSTKGGLTWIKSRSDATDHKLTDTARGVTKALISDTTGAQTTDTTGLTAFGTTGFTIGANTDYNTSAATYVSWTLRKQPKYFDIQTWTGSGANRTISHALGSVPGCIMVKRTDTTGAWQVYHRSLANTEYLVLNDTAAKATGATRWNSTTPTSTVFSLGTDATVNASAGTYVAYIFAHDAGGFGLTGTDNVISCGSYTGTGAAGNAVTLGYEPQWLMVKKTTSATQSDWVIFDNMRGWPVAGSADNYLWANSSNAEGSASTGWVSPNATGFEFDDGQNRTNGSGETYIYIAIRRGPMKVPTSGTTVFSPYTTAASTGTTVTTNFPVDFQLYKYRDGIDYFFDVDRLRGVNSTTTANSTPWLDTTATTAEASATNVSRNWGNTGFEVPGIVGGASNVFYSFKRAPSFFDEVCYLGTGSATTVAHNLGAVPELMIVKERNGANGWQVYSASLTNTDYLILNTSAAVPSPSTTRWNSTTPTSTVFSVGTHGATNGSGQNFVAYLFATCAGVSKVGSYTGTGTTKQIDCGFTGGARFVLIKRTDSTGSWYVWDSSRGIVSGNDPYLLLNSTAAEVTNTDYIDTYSAGFEISSTAPAEINASGGSFIFLAVA